MFCFVRRKSNQFISHFSISGWCVGLGQDSADYILWLVHNIDLGQKTVQGSIHCLRPLQ